MGTTLLQPKTELNRDVEVVAVGFEAANPSEVDSVVVIAETTVLPDVAVKKVAALLIALMPVERMSIKIFEVPSHA